jgi:hypothetical protein
MAKKVLAAIILALWMSAAAYAATGGQNWRPAVGKSHYVWRDPEKPDLKCEIVSGQTKRIEDPCKLIYLQCGERWRVKICGLMTGPVF